MKRHVLWGSVGLALCVAVMWKPATALSVEDAILYVLETNPEIKSAEANKQAIEFELGQARSLNAPRFELEGRAEGSINDGGRTIDSTASSDALAGYEVRARVIQKLFDGGDIRSEIERQAYRIDGAALRVLERSEFLSLEAVRVYADVLRTRELIRLANENVAYHRQIFTRIDRAFKNGVVGIADFQQAEERVLLADDILAEFQLDAIDAEILFLETVGVEPTGLERIPNVGGRIPASLDDALAKARALNPSVRFMQADVGAEEALSRRVDANRSPDLNLEADVRYGEDIGGFEGEVKDARVGLVLRYEFQGARKRNERQEQVRRVSEARARLLRQARLVEREVRQSWSSLESARRRAAILQRQAALAEELRTSYELEFDVGARSLLDVLNTQNSLFQAQASLVNARVTETFVNYRLLAAAGVLLNTLGITPPEDSNAYAQGLEGAPGVDAAGARSRSGAASFGEWRRSLDR